MKLLVLSDLHIEFSPFSPPSTQADVVVLAGDILPEHYGLTWARTSFPESFIVYVLGNHEFYCADYEKVLDTTRSEARKQEIALLECEGTVIGGIRFLGTTLWTDFEVDDSQPATAAMHRADRALNDFKLIRYRGGLLKAADTRRFHESAREWLSRELAKPFDGKTIVVTHHLPHRMSIDRRYDGDVLNPAFASHMPALVRPPVDSWIHGHTHCSCDYRVEGTRVVCNPRGYGPSDLNPQFNPTLLIEL